MAKLAWHHVHPSVPVRCPRYRVGARPADIMSAGSAVDAYRADGSDRCGISSARRGAKSNGSSPE